MTTYVYRDGKIIPKHEAGPRGGPQIIRDIDPYKAVAVDVATGKRPVIGSRREHKAFLKRNGYHEYTPIKSEPVYADVDRRELAQHVDRARQEVLSRRR
jgi:hypothetical protein